MNAAESGGGLHISTFISGNSQLMACCVTDHIIGLCLDCNHHLDDSNQGRCPECSRPFDPDDTKTFNNSGAPIGRAWRAILKAGPTPVVAIGAAILGYALWRMATPSIAMWSLWYLPWSLVCAFVLALRAPQLALRRQAELLLGVRASSIAPPRPAWPWLAGLIALATLLAATRAPLHVAFAVCRPTLNKLADVAIPHTFSASAISPTEVGPFNIEHADVRNDLVFLYLRDRTLMCRTALIRRRSISTTAVTPVQLGLEPNHEAFAQIADLDGQWYLLHDKQHANDTLGAFIERTLD